LKRKQELNWFIFEVISKLTKALTLGATLDINNN